MKEASKRPACMVKVEGCCARAHNTEEANMWPEAALEGLEGCVEMRVIDTDSTKAAFACALPFAGASPCSPPGPLAVSHARRRPLSRYSFKVCASAM